MDARRNKVSPHVDLIRPSLGEYSGVTDDMYNEDFEARPQSMPFKSPGAVAWCKAPRMIAVFILGFL
jgi:hypothetical protein